MTEENKSLRGKILDLDDENKKLKKQMKTLQAHIEAQEDYKLKVKKLENEL